MNFQRVWSNIGSSLVKDEPQRQSETQTDRDETPSGLPDTSARSQSLDNTLVSNVPPWMRDIHPSGATRQSRASSIISTRTKYSAMTLQDDARSIDIHVGGQTFRIARDGSRISDAPPPPYSDLEKFFPSLMADDEHIPSPVRGPMKVEINILTPIPPLLDD